MIPKFRAWDKIRNRISEVERIYIDTKGVRLRDENGEYWRRFDDVILMQSTGLFDVNGKEIFEGDVVLEDGWRKVAVSFGTQEIEENFGDKRIFQGFNLALGGGYPEAIMVDFEVLGNIYENPDLVEVNND
ncbi:TPA: hypothetical protein U1Z95_002317 [Streptococcus suis]|nr:hypothetical protein [Streptococcus suis]NQJ47399.1 hypothetical protein [Streptococcus suis]NQJ54666.1 hypothetical protein [Streptococcus suis]HEM4389147.1 hypothetical protein [Streptococcus suis]HEM4610723.1 hypothetical protein [Streptococcus suis]